MELDEERIHRHARQIVLPEIGGAGQLRLARSRVLIIGAGGLGSPLALYLAAAGIGTLGIVDHDTVELGNLQRQILHATADVGRAKTASAAARLAALDPTVRVEAHTLRLDADNADRLVAAYDVVADGSDNFATRALVQDACLRQGRPLVSAAVQGFEGQLGVFRPHLGPPEPCLRCLFAEPPAEDVLPSCAVGGVLGPAAGVVGCLQAVEVVKLLLGLEPLRDLLLYDALGARLDRVRIARRAICTPRCARPELHRAGG
jgi:molybdopterin/thiamine biosynthesis adenylyltransferase